jgi:hypothetical protein
MYRLYGSSGGIELQEIVNGLINTQMYNPTGISIALIFINVGLGFKLSPALGIPSNLEVLPQNLRGGWIKYYFHKVREGLCKIT